MSVENPFNQDKVNQILSKNGVHIPNLTKELSDALLKSMEEIAEGFYDFCQGLNIYDFHVRVGNTLNFRPKTFTELFNLYNNQNK